VGHHAIPFEGESPCDLLCIAVPMEGIEVSFQQSLKEKEGTNLLESAVDSPTCCDSLPLTENRRELPLLSIATEGKKILFELRVLMGFLSP